MEIARSTQNRARINVVSECELRRWSSTLELRRQKEVGRAGASDSLIPSPSLSFTGLFYLIAWWRLWPREWICDPHRAK